jgi:hypothetical protein
MTSDAPDEPVSSGLFTHVEALFEKLGVSSRQELVGRVFLEDYRPEIVDGTPLTSRGRFEERPPGRAARP